MQTPTIRYRVAFPDPGRHVYEITLTIEGLPTGKHRLRLPVWTPGNYRVSDFSGQLFGLTATFGDQPLPAPQVRKNEWGVETAAVGTVTLRYSVWAYQEGVSQSHLDPTHAFWNGAQLFFLVDEYRELPYRVEIAVPDGWQVSTGLDPVAGTPHLYEASNYDVLIDSPVEVGTHRTLTFQVDGKVHTIALWGEGNEEPSRLVGDVERIVRSERDIFGGLPYDHYTFIFHLSASPTGGLEHLNSTVCGMERFSFRPWKSYRRVLELIAHEFFHLWNVKRIHPEMLGPFDYDREVHTHLLWAMEGLTDYYADLSLRRSGLFSLEDYCAVIAERVERYEKLPGRFVQSLSASSFETWTKFYRRTADSPNRQISYYLKGELVGICLDLEIRRRTGGMASLDEVLRRLFDRYGRHGVGFPESVYQETVEEVAGGSFADFFARYVDGVDSLPLDEALAGAGLVVRRAWKAVPNEEDGKPVTTPQAWLGVDLRAAEGAVEVATSYEGTGAAALLAPGDRIVALDGYAFDGVSGYEKRVREDFAPGDEVTITLLRRKKLETVRLRLATAPCDHVRIERVAQPTPTMVETLRAWLGAE